MADLTGTKPKDTYGGLLQIPNSNLGIDATLRTIQDGKGNSSQLKLSSTAVGIGAITDVETTIGLKAALSSPTFTGTPAAPTAVTTTNTTQLSTTAFVQQELTNQAVLLTGTQTVAGVKTLSSNLKVLEPDATASNRGFTIGTRDVAVTFPVPTMRPVSSNQCLAFDLMPNGSPTENANGFTWIDVCSADILSNNSTATNAARVAITSTAATFSSRLFNGASALPLKLQVQTGASTTVDALYISTTGKKIGLNLNTPQYSLHLHEDLSTTAVAIAITNGSSGSANTDGLNIGLDNAATPNAYVLQRENADLQFWTAATKRAWITGTGGVNYLATNTAAGTTGARTINNPSGTVNFAATATTLVVTNSLVTTASLIFAVIRTNDSTATIKNVVPASGSFTITLTAAATAETSVGFFVIN